jgi:hypothetical protein
MIWAGIQSIRILLYFVSLLLPQCPPGKIYKERKEAPRGLMLLGTCKPLLLIYKKLLAEQLKIFGKQRALSLLSLSG